MMGNVGKHVPPLKKELMVEFFLTWMEGMQAFMMGESERRGDSFMQ